MTKAPDPNTPHAPHRELGNQYAMRAPRERRAFMTGELNKLNARCRYLEASQSTWTPRWRGWRPLRSHAGQSPLPRCKSKLFGAGKLNAMILTVMRKADRPRKRREVTTGMRIEAGFEEEAEDGLRPHVRVNLFYLTKVRGLLLKDGDREKATWALNAGSRPKILALRATQPTSSLPRET